MFAEILTVLNAYHEAGHAVVGHVLGRCIASISLLPAGESGYRGYCSFDSFIEDTNGHPEWHKRSANPDLITIYYAGMLSTAHYCSLYLALDGENDSVTYPEGSELDDLVQIQEVLSRMGTDQQGCEAVTDSCWVQAQKILSEYHLAVNAVATELVEQGSLGGRVVHDLIWQTIGYPDDDWRFMALEIQR